MLVLGGVDFVIFCLSDARVMWDQKTGRSRGFGFVSFRNQQVYLCGLYIHIVVNVTMTDDSLIFFSRMPKVQ